MIATRRRLRTDPDPPRREERPGSPGPQRGPQSDPRSDLDRGDLGSLLSSRESEIVVLVVRGLSNKEIARTLDISHWTVSSHLRRVFCKLEVSRRIELCRFAEEALRWQGLS